MSAKDTTTYWKKKIAKRQINGVNSAHYYARMSHEDRRAWINLDTGDKDTAASTAALKYATLKREGWESVKPTKSKSADITVGQWIKAVEDANCLRDATIKSYARKLRQLAGEIRGIGGKSRFAAKHSGDWIKSVDKVKLSELTTERVKKWKTRRLNGITDHQEKSRAENTANSVIRNVKGIFGRKVLESVTLELEEIPLKDIRAGAMKKTKFTPEVDFDQLIKDAANELETDLHLIFLLAAGCGLRRSEIDRLRRQDVDLKAGTVTITDTEDGQTKTEASHRTVRFSNSGPIFEALKNSQLGIYAICPSLALPNKRKAETYRCEHQFAALSNWLRSKGVKNAIQPLHYLRKACGDRIARDHGIAATANTLGNSIQMAYAVYSDHSNTKAIL
jgi:integrase